MPSDVVENELDIRGLCCCLWRGKRWIIGLALLFAVIAWLATLLMKQVWSTTAMTERPTVNMLGSYYAQQQFLSNLDVHNNALTLSAPSPTIMDEVYQEFVMQLSSWDTRREFWQQTDYFKSRKTGNAHNDAALLDDLIGNVQFTPADTAHSTFDNVKLKAETASDANNLLRQYIAYASERAARHLNTELTGAWQVQGQLETLQATGPTYDISYDQNRAMLTTLQAGPALNSKFQTYRYLRTPEEPVSRDSPRRLFMMIMWGAIGALVGAGVALMRRPRPMLEPRH
ncbi:Wzz/FepE/Etk N-terminal domain-containing protein [Escherichia coli]|uniref:Wzz/FepE/Etk N-terminal domain-containing protein n=1 Tax=Escherichia coli TaxID=562 RepID=UPI002DB6EEE7|nr:Wzz/FepE/Etk N-terminal domain-containing protein [Escherichia coli]MEC4256633.1 Wzz/FepE/Etk N-terminal domain-containing protein [Escherichia coli]